MLTEAIMVLPYNSLTSSARRLLSKAICLLYQRFCRRWWRYLAEAAVAWGYLWLSTLA